MASVITAERIADLIEQAPGWALVGLAMPQERVEVVRTTRGCRVCLQRALYRPMDVEAGHLALP